MKQLIAFPVLLAFCLGFSASFHASAQSLATGGAKEYKNAITLHPLYLINSGVRIDYDRRIQGRHWLQAGLTGYRSSGPDFFRLWMLDDWRGAKATGAALELNYKYFPFPRVKFIYFTAGAAYSHFDVKYSGFSYEKYPEDGLTFYEPRQRTLTQMFDRIETSARIAIQTRPLRRIFVDFYVGAGYRFSFYDEQKPYPYQTMMNLGYRGPTLTTGFRIGTRF
jgi:hypothetical protein